jgi:RNA polymerase sigma-70 factor (ECF subfamily)
MELVQHGRAAPDAALAVAPTTAAARAWDERKRVPVRRRTPDAVRADLDQVFRRDYPLVVGVAARVLGSREEAEDVAQDVFLSFSRSSVPAGEARGLAVRGRRAHRPQRAARRPPPAVREETAATAEDASVSDVAETVVTLEERRRVRAALARSPTSTPSPSCCGTAA